MTTQTVERTDPRVTVYCATCGHQGRALPRLVPDWRCVNCRPERGAPEAVNVDWPRLVALAEQRGIPVLRIDEHGAPHIIRSTQQLQSDWEN